MQNFYTITIKCDGNLKLSFKCRDDALDILKTIFETADESENGPFKIQIMEETV